ncbi:MAG: hypothetical protein RLZZ229_533 [Actinomycetota bacterium]|jgi:hypothetical protein
MRLSDIICEVPAADLDAFQALGSTIGGKIIYPGNKVDNKPTINVSRGFNSRIVDRFDLTLECIRRFYLGEQSPLFNDLGRYSDFFNLFGNFQGYVDFFLLQDLLDGDRIKFFMPFTSVFDSARPRSLYEYREYMANTMDFVSKRNQRINIWFLQNPTGNM